MDLVKKDMQRVGMVQEAYEIGSNVGKCSTALTPRWRSLMLDGG